MCSHTAECLVYKDGSFTNESTLWIDSFRWTPGADTHVSDERFDGDKIFLSRFTNHARVVAFNYIQGCSFESFGVCWRHWASFRAESAVLTFSVEHWLYIQEDLREGNQKSFRICRNIWDEKQQHIYVILIISVPRFKPRPLQSHLT